MSAANRTKVIVVYFVTIILLFCDGSSSQNIQTPPNPCPDTFKYIFDGNEYYGIITQRNTSEPRREIKLRMTQPGILNQDYKGKISPNINLNIISDYINLGLPITYRVDFPQKNVLPRVTDIIDNGIRVCNGPKDSSPRAEINMKIVLQENTISPELRSLNSVCGQENVSVKNLTKRAVYGDVIDKSRFPWIAAIYKKRDNGLLFQCGGTLISKRSVISSSHCFCISSKCSKAEDILVSLGRHDLNYPSGVNIGVLSIVIHPQYRSEYASVDTSIAIVQLLQSVTFSHAIRPICLWDGPSDLKLIEGITGVTVGWGADETYAISALPKSVRVTIVSTSECLRSNAAFQNLISNRTFCAGKRDGSGPCKGDSGNGLIIKNRNKWTLRGIASASLTNSDQTCNLQEYVVYSDIAKFIDWIKAYMLL